MLSNNYTDNVREPISGVYQKDIQLRSINKFSVESDTVLLNTIKAYLCVQLIHQYSPLFTPDTIRREILDELKEIKRTISSTSTEGYSVLLNSEWHLTLFRPTHNGQDQLMWHCMHPETLSDLACIYEGEYYVTHDCLNKKIISNNPKFILISDNTGPCILWYLGGTYEIVITFPAVAIRIFKVIEGRGIHSVISNLLTDKKYDLTGYYLKT